MVAGFNETANDGKYQLICMNVCWTAHFVCTRVSWRRVRLDVEVKYCADQTILTWHHNAAFECSKQ